MTDRAVPMVRHKFRNGQWDMQCPTCRQFVQIDVAVMEGRAPFPRHRRWAASWMQLLAERYPRVRFSSLTPSLIKIEAGIRRAWWEPHCVYGEQVNWRALMRPSGICSFGPLDAA